MIRSFEIRNFKRFERLDVDGLGRITVMGGRNNTGKSSFLEAVFMHYDRFNPGMLVRHMSWRGVQEMTVRESALAPAFHRYDVTRCLRLGAVQNGSSDAVEITVDPNSRLRRIALRAVAERPLTGPGRLADRGASIADVAVRLRYLHDNQEVNKADLVVHGDELRLNLETEPDKVPTAVYLGARMLGDPNVDAERFGELDVAGETEYLTDFLKIIDSRIVSLSSISMGNLSLLHADIGIGRKIPVNFLGDGTLRLLGIILAMAHARHGVVLIDEIDSGLHHSVLPAMWTRVAAAADHFDCQILATTHSYGVLQAAKEGLSGLTEPDFAYFRLDEDNGGIVPRRYSFAMLATALENWWEVR